jgi:hypothetical protein
VDRGAIVSWLIARETIVDLSSRPTITLLDRMPLSCPLDPGGPHKIVEVADIVLWRIEQRYEFPVGGEQGGGESECPDRYWHVQTTGADWRWTETDSPHAHRPYVVHRVLDRAHALIHYILGIVEIYVAEMIPANIRAVALDACLQGDRKSFLCADQLCATHAATERLARLSLETLIIEAGNVRAREQAASYQ